MPPSPTETELAEIRQRLKALPLLVNEHEHRGGSKGSRESPLVEALTVGVWSRERATVIGNLLDHAFTDPLTLSAALAERDDLIWRMSQDQLSYLLGQETERRAVLDVICPLLRRCYRQRRRVTIYDIETEVIGVRGPVGNLLPPDQSRAEIDRLRGVLHSIVDVAAKGFGLALLDQVRELASDGLEA